MKNLLKSKIGTQINCPYCNKSLKQDFSCKWFSCKCGMLLELNNSDLIEYIIIDHNFFTFRFDFLYDLFIIDNKDTEIYRSNLILLDFSKPLIPQLNIIIAFL